MTHLSWGIKTLPLLLLIVGKLATASHREECKQVSFGKPEEENIACRCDATTCDSLHFQWPLEDDLYLRVLSSKAGARFQVSQLRADKLEGRQRETDYVVAVEANHRKQQVTGFGGAFTDSAAQQILLLPEQVRRKLINDYFGPHGLDYNLGRVPIAGTDMSTRAYTYDDLPVGENLTDFGLEHFKLQPEDLLFKIPLIKRVNRLRQERRLEPLKLLASTWAPPAWMKTNENLVGGELRAEGDYQGAYARYVLRFLEEYAGQNLSMWGLSPQNEPRTPSRSYINFNSCNFSPKQMAAYLSEWLVPELERAKISREQLKLFIWDDTLTDLAPYQRAMLDSSARHFIAGLSLHWYSQGLSENDYSYADLYEARHRLPSRYSMISTEASFIGRPQPGNWFRGQRYALDVLLNLRAGSIGWVDWNLALNTEGGPTWAHNYLDAAVLVDLESESYLKNPMYYALGQVTRFIQPGSWLVKSWVAPADEPSRRDWLQDDLVAVAAELEEPQQVGAAETRRRFALVLLNRSPQRKRITLELKHCRAKRRQPNLQLELDGHSISSLAYLC